MSYTGQLSSSVMLGPMSASDFASYKAEMEGPKAIPFKYWVVNSQYYCVNSGASFGDFKAIAVYFAGFGWSGQPKRPQPIPAAYYIYQLLFDANGGTIPSTTATKAFDEEFIVGKNPAFVPTSFGKIFKGWATSATGDVVYAVGSSIPNTAFPTATVPTSASYPDGLQPANCVGSGSLTLYAVWAIATFDVYLDGTKQYKVTTGESLPIVTLSPTRVGYKFDGYYDSPQGGTCYYNAELNLQFDTFEGEADLHLYTHWTPIKYTIRFTAATATSGEMSPIVDVEYDTTVVIPACGFLRTGYTFNNWYTSYGNYESNNSVLNLSATDGAIVILDAVWRPITTTITFSAPSANVNTSPQIVNCTYDAVFVVPECKAHKQGYKFMYWADTSDSTKYYANQQVLFQGTTAKTMTAVFEVTDGLIVLMPAIIPAGQTEYSFMLYQPLDTIELRNSNNNRITAYDYTLVNNVLKIVLRSSRVDNVSIIVNGSNNQWHKALMFTKTSATKWKITDIYVRNDKGFILNK